MEPAGNQAEESFIEILDEFLRSTGVKPVHWDSWLAKHLGITRQSANRIRRGVCRPKVMTCVALARVMEMDVEIVLEKTGHGLCELFEIGFKLNPMSAGREIISAEDLYYF